MCSFIQQLKQWKAFEEENQTIRRMAKYFSTPSKSLHTQYGEEQSCHVRGEKNSMERLLTEVSETLPAGFSIKKSSHALVGPICLIANILSPPPISPIPSHSGLP